MLCYEEKDSKLRGIEIIVLRDTIIFYNDLKGTYE